MSAASDLRLTGFTTLLDDDGETCVFHAADDRIAVVTVSAVVDYLGDEPKVMIVNGRRQDEDRTKSVIEILKSSITSQPVEGDWFVNADGRTHRVTKALRSTDITYVSECLVSTPSSS